MINNKIDGMEYETSVTRKRQLTKPTVRSHSTSVRKPTGHAKGVGYDTIRPQTLSIARTSRVAGKKTPGLWKKMQRPFATAATPISLRIPPNTTSFKSKDLDKKKWTLSSSHPTSIVKRTAKRRRYTGSYAYKNLKFHLSLIGLMALAWIGAKEYLDNWVATIAYIGVLWFISENLIRKR